MLTLVTKNISLNDAVAAVRSRALPHTQLRSGARYTREDFLAFCDRYPDVEAELLEDGSIEIMSPQVLQSNERENIVSTLLTAWWLANGRPGKVYGPTAGFTLPSGSIRSPDAAWVSPERIAALPAGELETMARLVPDFVIEVTPKSDRLKRAKKKMRNVWIANGVRLGWLIDARKQRVFVYQEGVEGVEEILGFDRVLTPAIPAGFAFDLRELR